MKHFEIDEDERLIETKYVIWYKKDGDVYYISSLIGNDFNACRDYNYALKMRKYITASSIIEHISLFTNIELHISLVTTVSKEIA